VIVVVVPAYEEEERIGRVISGLPSSVGAVIVVDDASRDRTSEVARLSGDSRVEVIRHAENRGVGAAIVTGYRRALERTSNDTDAFVVMAGDGQMDPRDLPALVAPITSGEAGYVKGERFSAPDVRTVMPVFRRLGGEVLSRLTSRAIGVPITDSQCGYTALSRRACSQLDLDGLYPRYGYPNDLLGQLAARGIPIREVPVRPIYAGEESKLRAWHVPTITRLIARAWLRRARAR